MKKIPDYTVVYSDDDIVVLNKKSGLLIAQDRYDAEAPRLDLEASKEFGKLFAVHRIDKDTSGIIIYARNSEAHKNISGQFEKRTVEKTYHCVVRGRPNWETLSVSLPLLPDGDARHRTVVNKKIGKESHTDFRVLGSSSLFSWIEAKPKTGRTHQIRVHLAESGFPIVCDPLYSGNLKPVYLSDIKHSWRGNEDEERPLLRRLGLHAYRISFDHPVSGERLTFTAPFQKDMDALRKQMEKLFHFSIEEN
ncbi:MAG: RluA family pseudouridine synthase [Treponema sp.]|nr:RluA family pseudouridine synthase [Treponema sp.]